MTLRKYVLRKVLRGNQVNDERKRLSRTCSCECELTFPPPLRKMGKTAATTDARPHSAAARRRVGVVKEGVVKEGPYMTREASRRLRQAIDVAQNILTTGGSVEQAAAAAQRYGAHANGAESSGGSDGGASEAEEPCGLDDVAAISLGATASTRGSGSATLTGARVGRTDDSAQTTTRNWASLRERQPQ